MRYGFDNFLLFFGQFHIRVIYHEVQKQKSPPKRTDKIKKRLTSKSRNALTWLHKQDCLCVGNVYKTFLSSLLKRPLQFFARPRVQDGSLVATTSPQLAVSKTLCSGQRTIFASYCSGWKYLSKSVFKCKVMKKNTQLGVFYFGMW